MLSSPVGIKSIQNGTLTIAASGYSNTATITAVNTSKSVLNYLGVTILGASTSMPGPVNIELTNSTTVTGKAGYSVAAAHEIKFQVIEFF